MKYYLIGYMYSGKSTFGRQLAAEKGMDFLDLDRVFEERYHYTVPRFFAQFGEPAFRKLETQMLHDTAPLDNVVIATGAIRMEGTSKEYAPVEYPAVPDFTVTNALREAAEQAAMRAGVALSVWAGQSPPQNLPATSALAPASASYAPKSSRTARR